MQENGGCCRMFWNRFRANRVKIEEQYRKVQWIEESGLSPDELAQGVSVLMQKDAPRPLQKAETFAFVLDHAQLAVEPAELIQDHIRHDFLLQKGRAKWKAELTGPGGPLCDISRQMSHLHDLGLGVAAEDFGHTVPDWQDILSLGFPGLLKRLQTCRDAHRAAGTLTEERSAFYDASIMAYEAVLRYLRRLAGECRKAAAAETEESAARLRFCADDLEALAEHAPQTLHQALQQTYIYHILQEEIEGERLRSLGGLDRLYAPFMQSDLENESLTEEQITELWQDFFQKFHALTGDTFYGEPMYLGGTLPDGACAVNTFSYIILHAYDQLNVANPKFHIRWSQHTPPEFIRAVLDCIRRGNSSFVFISDACAVPMMMRQVGATLEEARDYVPIGCYEPGIQGREVACTGNGSLSMPKALELALNNGVDPRSGEQLGPWTGECEDFSSYEQLEEAVLRQLYAAADTFTSAVRAYEKYYMRINPSPLFSGTLVECVENGLDAYAGGAKYNNSSLNCAGSGTLADSLAMIQKVVYERNEMGLKRLNDILRGNWRDQELTRLRMRKDPDKWGNNRERPDDICCRVSEKLANYINAIPNARGGHFKTGLYSIDRNYYYGEKLGASADGRRAGEIISRNTGAASTMDRSGVTALIHSVSKLDHTLFANGTVLDVMLHPTAVAGEEGLDAFYQLLVTYFQAGGFAIHGNVMDAQVLREAQRDPEGHSNLQVRVCGWNVYFVNLNKKEQDEFIARAEA